MARSQTDPESHIACLKIEGRGDHDAYILIVTANEERTFYESRIFFYPEFPNQEGIVALSLATWLVDFTVDSAGIVHAAAADGRIWRSDGAETASIKISDLPLSRVCGPLETEVIAVAGDGGRVFRLDGAVWTDLACPLQEHLTDITALTPDDIYVCGLNGSFAHWNGRTWVSIDLSTDLDLYTVGHNPAGCVVVAGQAGALYTGTQATGFERVFGSEVGLYGLCPYEEGFVLAAPGLGFYHLSGTQLKVMREGFAPYRVSARGRVIFAAADSDVVLFTGKEWLSLPAY